MSRVIDEVLEAVLELEFLRCGGTYDMVLCFAYAESSQSETG